MGWLFLFNTSGGCSLWVASFGSNHSASPVKWYLRWTHILCSLSWGGLRTAWKNRRTEPLPTAAAVGRQPAHSLRCLCSTSIARTTDQSVLTDGLRRAGSRQRFRPRSSSHCRPVGRISARAALPMVDDSACDRNPLTADRGSAGGMPLSSFRLPFLVFQWLLRMGDVIFLPAAPFRPWDDFPMQR